MKYQNNTANGKNPTVEIIRLTLVMCYIRSPSTQWATNTITPTLAVF